MTSLARIRPRIWAKVRPLIPYGWGLGALAALLLVATPARFAQAMGRFDVRYAPILACLSLAYYLLQGVRWHPLLRAVGARLGLGPTVLVSVAGQAAGLLPGGELFRALLVSEVAGIEVGDAAATVTVQELIYTVFMIATAVPASLSRTEAAVGVAASLLGVALVLAVLGITPVFERVIKVLRRIPLARRFVGDIEELRQSTVGLLGRRDTWAWAPVSALQVLVTVTLFWLVLEAVEPGRVDFAEAALVYAVAHLAGSLSFSPGGLGGFEAVCVGMLLATGVPLQAALAAAILQRLADKGLGSCFGALAYLYVRRHYHLAHRRVVRHRGQRRRRRPKAS